MVVWANEVGGSLLMFREVHHEIESRARDQERCFITVSSREKKSASTPGFDKKGRDREEGERSNSAFTAISLYKEALLRGLSSFHTKTPPLTRTYRDLRSSKGTKLRSSPRCFKCLASGHEITDCRDSVRFLRCRRSATELSTARSQICGREPLRIGLFGKASEFQRFTYLTQMSS